MFGSSYDYLRPAQLGTLLSLKKRQTAKVLGELEALGYDLPADGQGARMVHPELAAAVKDARERNLDLLHLRLTPKLNKFLRRGRAPEPDALETLIEVSAEVDIVRAAVGALSTGLRGIGNASWQREGWKSLGLPDPRSDL